MVCFTKRLWPFKTVSDDAVLFKYAGQIDFVMIAYYTGDVIVSSKEPDYMQDYLIEEIIKDYGILVQKIIIV